MDGADYMRQRDRDLDAALGWQVDRPTGDATINAPAEALLAKVEALLAALSIDEDRDGRAREVLNSLIPVMVDVDLWRDLAAGRNIDLPISDQYGPVASRLSPLQQTGARKRGKVHSKGDQAPSAFMRRQGEFMAANANRIARAEAELQRLREERASIEHGLSLYATTALLTAIRKAAAPAFALGPAWAVLSAIQGPVADELSPADRERETQAIMVVLHALRDNDRFKSEVKSALLAVCSRYAGEAKRAQKDIFDFNTAYAERLELLEWPRERYPPKEI